MPSDPSPRPMDLDQALDFAASELEAFSWLKRASGSEAPQHDAAAAQLRTLAPLLREWVEAMTALLAYHADPDADGSELGPRLDRRDAATRALLTHLTQSTPTAPGATDG